MYDYFAYTSYGSYVGTFRSLEQAAEEVTNGTVHSERGIQLASWKVGPDGRAYDKQVKQP